MVLGPAQTCLPNWTIVSTQCRSRPVCLSMASRNSSMYSMASRDIRSHQTTYVQVPRCIRVACTATSQKVPPSESNSPGRDSLQHAAPGVQPKYT